MRCTDWAAQPFATRRQLVNKFNESFNSIYLPASACRPAMPKGLSLRPGYANNLVTPGTWLVNYQLTCNHLTLGQGLLHSSRGLSLANWARHLLNLMRIKRGHRKGCTAWSWPAPAYLCLRQAESLGQLLALRSHHIMIALKGVLQLKQLRGREGGAHPLWLAKRLQQEVCKGCSHIK